MSRLFKGITVVVTIIGIMIIIWLEGDLLRYCFIPTKLSNNGGMWAAWVTATKDAEMIKNIKLLIIANAVEIALVWLLVLLNIISKYRGLIVTLVLFILAGITSFIVISFISFF